MVNSAIFTIVFVCIIAIIVEVANSQKTNMEEASKEKTQTLQEQEEQRIPKALTEIKAREPNTNNFTYVTSEDNIKVPVPKGYVASTDVEERYVNGVTIDGIREHHGGFVIYEKKVGGADEQAIEEIETDIDTAQRERNQWVWVPVDDVTDMYHISENYIYANAYTFTSSSYSKVINVSREPELVANYDRDNTYLKQFLEGISRNEFLQEMREEFYGMLESVARYGGYYIGRYETGNISTKVPVIAKENSDISNLNWYKMYQKCKNLKGKNKAAQTGMVWGIQWDETLKWIIDSGEKTYAEIYNSNSWGNHGPYRSAKSTGYSESWKANNIYDLAGNVWDWTMEVRSDNLGLYRGGTFWYAASDYSAWNRGDQNKTYVGEHAGCRSTMYIL